MNLVLIFLIFLIADASPLVTNDISLHKRKYSGLKVGLKSSKVAGKGVKAGQSVDANNMCGRYDLREHTRDAKQGWYMVTYTQTDAENRGITCDSDENICPMPCINSDQSANGIGFDCAAFCRQKLNNMKKFYSRYSCVHGSGSCRSGCFCHD